MTELQFFAIYAFMLLIGSAFCIGFYIITKAEKGTSPDGKIEYYGKIFKWWGQFLQMEKRWPKVTHFTGYELAKKGREIGRTIPRLKGAFFLSTDGKWLGCRQGIELTEDEVDTIKMANRCQAVGFKDETMYAIQLYEEESDYVFPEWVRMPLGQCPPCMASVFGSLIYWGIYFVQPGLFSWAYRPVAAVWGFWVLFCISLSCLNVVFYKKTH